MDPVYKDSYTMKVFADSPQLRLSSLSQSQFIEKRVVCATPGSHLLGSLDRQLLPNPIETSSANRKILKNPFKYITQSEVRDPDFCRMRRSSQVLRLSMGDCRKCLSVQFTLNHSHFSRNPSQNLITAKIISYLVQFFFLTKFKY